jgi:hypothetical protein
MPLFKDLSTNLNKILMQSSKSNLQLEKTISSTKTSIKNIKDVKLNVKDLKLNNDKFNKAVEEFKLSSIELFDKIDKYLKNPTPEKALKVKYQSNVSNDYLTKATTVFSESKTFIDKAFDSFNKYKNNNSINNIKELIEWNQKLILSFKKNIRITTPVSKLKTQTRKVYSLEAPTPSPDCQELKKELTAKELEINKVTTELDAFIEKVTLGDEYKKTYETNNKVNLEYIANEKKRLGDLQNEFMDYFRELDELAKINSDIIRNEKAIINNINRNYFKKVNDLKENAKILLSFQAWSISKIQASVITIGNNTEEAVNKEQENIEKFRTALADDDADYQEWAKIEKSLRKSDKEIESLKETKEKLRREIFNLGISIKKLNCP